MQHVATGRSVLATFAGTGRAVVLLPRGGGQGVTCEAVVCSDSQGANCGTKWHYA